MGWTDYLALTARYTLLFFDFHTFYREIRCQIEDGSQWAKPIMPQCLFKDYCNNDGNSCDYHNYRQIHS